MNTPIYRILLKSHNLTLFAKPNTQNTTLQTIRQCYCFWGGSYNLFIEQFK